MTQASTTDEHEGSGCPFSTPVALPISDRSPLDPPAEYAQLRASDPVHSGSAYGVDAWIVSRYDDVRRALSDPKISADMCAPGFPNLPPFLSPSEEQRHFLRMDPPEHTMWRRMMARHFTPKKVAELRARVEALVHRHIDAMLAGDDRPVDLMTAVARPVPSAILAWMLGLPEDDGPFFNQAVIDILDGMQKLDDNEIVTRMVESLLALRQYLQNTAEAREQSDLDGDDVLSDMLRAKRDGTITMEQIVNTSFVLIGAGHDTTASSVGLGMLALFEHPAQMEALRKDPTRIPRAVEELVRYLTVVHLLIARVVKEDTEIGERTLRAGQAVWPLTFSANRDERHFERPDELDFDREVNDHLGFGFGVHACLGASLARMELAVIFEALLTRIPTLRLAVPVEDLPARKTSVVSGLDALPVTW